MMPAHDAIVRAEGAASPDPGPNSALLTDGSDDYELKLEIAGDLIGEREAASGRQFDPLYREILQGEIAASRSIENLEAALQKGEPVLLPGDSNRELVYTPVAPCRILDTRFAGGPIATNTRRAFQVAGSVGFPGQGGNPGGCGVPFGPATTAFINIVAVNSSGSGNLRAFAYPQPTPFAASLNYGVIPGLNAIANGLAVPICDPSSGPCAFDLYIYSAAASTNVVVDVVGYHTAFNTDVISRGYSSFTIVNETSSPVSERNALTNILAPRRGGFLVDFSFNCASFDGTTNTRWNISPRFDGALIGGNAIPLFFPHGGAGDPIGDSGSVTFFRAANAGSHRVSWTASRSAGNGSLDCDIWVSSEWVPYNNNGVFP